MTIQVEQVCQASRTASLTRFRSTVKALPNMAVICDARGDFLIHHASFGGNLPVLEYLLAAGVAVSPPGDRGVTPLHYATANGHLEAARLLLEHGAEVSPTNKNGMTPLHIAAGLGRLDLLQMLVGRGAIVRSGDKFGRLPVHYAAGAGRLKAVKALVSLDADCLDGADQFGMRPLHWACYFENHQLAAWLLRQGADKAPLDIYGRSPGYFARLSGLEKMRAISVQLPVKGKPGYTCPDLHRRILSGDGSKCDDGWEGVVAPTETDSLGRTLLHCAAFARDRETYDRLRERGGISTSAVDQYGWRAVKLLSYRMMVARPSQRASAPGNSPGKEG